MEILEMLQSRHSIRKYTGEPIPEESLNAVLRAGLLSASSRSIRPWEMIVVRDREKLRSLAGCRIGSAKMLENADTAIVVIANSSASDVWVEDCSIVMANMHLAADSLGLGSCWIQGRLRQAPDGTSTGEYVRSLLGFPENYCLEAILSLGMPASRAPKTELSELLYQKIHHEGFGSAQSAVGLK